MFYARAMSNGKFIVALIQFYCIALMEHIIYWGVLVHAVLATSDYIKVTQREPYGDILISRGAKMWMWLGAESREQFCCRGSCSAYIRVDIIIYTALTFCTGGLLGHIIVSAEESDRKQVIRQ